MKEDLSGGERDREGRQEVVVVTAVAALLLVAIFWTAGLIIRTELELTEKRSKKANALPN
jgi:hypothetical protein